MCICQATATEPEISLWTSALRQGKLSTTRWAKSDDRSGPGRTIKLTGLVGARMTPMARPVIRNGALLNSGTLSPNPWDLTLSGQNTCWRYTEGARTEDKAPQGCDLSADSSAGMARSGLDAEAVHAQNQTRRILAYCRPKMVLTTGATLNHQRIRYRRPDALLAE